MKKLGAEFDRGDLERHIHENTQIVDNSGGGEPYPEEYRIPLDIVSEVVRAIPSAIADAIVEFGRVEIADFGVFTTQHRDPDTGTLPDGSTWTIPERMKIVFRPSPALLRIIAERTGMPCY